MRRAKSGDTVSVHYSGMRSDGAVFDTSSERGPMELTIGERKVLAGFEDALLGMAEGDTKTVTLEPDDAYGPRAPQLVQVVERVRLPANIELGIGTRLQATDSNGNQILVVVVDMSDDEVTVDANHPLAGEQLTFELQLVEFVG